MSGPKPKDLTGKRFGKLTAIEPVFTTTNNGNIRKKWKCKCDCGEERMVGCSELTWQYGGVKSCGHCGRLNENKTSCKSQMKCNKSIKIRDTHGYNLIQT